MFIHPNIAKEILKTLIDAETGGKPLTLKEALEKWGNGSTWEDLVDSGYIQRFPEAVTVTLRGLDWYNGSE